MKWVVGDELVSTDANLLASAVFETLSSLLIFISFFFVRNNSKYDIFLIVCIPLFCSPPHHDIRRIPRLTPQAFKDNYRLSPFRLT